MIELHWSTRQNEGVMLFAHRFMARRMARSFRKHAIWFAVERGLVIKRLLLLLVFVCVATAAQAQETRLTPQAAVQVLLASRSIYNVTNLPSIPAGPVVIAIPSKSGDGPYGPLVLSAPSILFNQTFSYQLPCLRYNRR